MSFMLSEKAVVRTIELPILWSILTSHLPLHPQHYPSDQEHQEPHQLHGWRSLRSVATPTPPPSGPIQDRCLTTLQHIRGETANFTCTHTIGISKKKWLWNQTYDLEVVSILTPSFIIYFYNFISGGTTSDMNIDGMEVYAYTCKCIMNWKHFQKFHFVRVSYWQ